MENPSGLDAFARVCRRMRPNADSETDQNYSGITMNRAMVVAAAVAAGCEPTYGRPGYGPPAQPVQPVTAPPAAEPDARQPEVLAEPVIADANLPPHAETCDRTCELALHGAHEEDGVVVYEVAGTKRCATAGQGAGLCAPADGKCAPSDKCVELNAWSCAAFDVRTTGEHRIVCMTSYAVCERMTDALVGKVEVVNYEACAIFRTKK